MILNKPKQTFRSAASHLPAASSGEVFVCGGLALPPPNSISSFQHNRFLSRRHGEGVSTYAMRVAAKLGSLRATRFVLNVPAEAYAGSDLPPAIGVPARQAAVQRYKGNVTATGLGTRMRPAPEICEALPSTGVQGE